MLAFALSYAAEKTSDLTRPQKSAALEEVDRAGESIDWEVVSAGGTSAASENYQLAGTSGQTAVGSGSSENYGVAQGYWQSFESGPAYVCGDADGNDVVNVSDIVWMINFVFGTGDPPDPLAAGDVDCNGSVNVSDIVCLINFVFGTGKNPCDPDDDGVPDC
jgi:hypothetical protein